VTSARSAFLGIDLGTTNSAAAVFDGEKVEVVRNAEGASITPSVVRIDARGNATVGARARRSLEKDPENVRAEFKRLMGSPHALRFAASGLDKRPEELSAEVLKAIREDVRAQFGVLPARAVISVPALFELPQNAATSEAARLAGFDRVELIQEPVASAIAAGFKADEQSGAWLVYDLGGGTFDVSLLETQEGLLRVVGHDGDNFLGGRDFDAAIVDHLVERIAAEAHVTVSRTNSDHAVALRRLRVLAEEAKIELTRARETEVSIAALDVGATRVDLDVVLARETMERLVEPLVMRSIAICERLLRTHGIVPGSGALSRVVLVGGPSAMPMLRERVAGALAAPFGEGLDPMTLVAQGAALFAANAGMDARPAVSAAAQPAGAKIWLQYPAMSSDVSPYVVGKLVDRDDAARVAKITILRDDGQWSSDVVPLDAEGTFAVMVNLAPRASSTFRIEGRAPGDDEVKVALSPPAFTIIHGVTIGDPPLSRSVGVALANGRVHSYFTRGSPLPMRRMFGLRTIEALSPTDPEGVLRVPIVQGEFPFAHLCRLVGSLEIRAREMKSPLPAGAPLEVTIELDRGGRVTSSARIPQTGQVFDGVAHLISAAVPLSELSTRLMELSRNLQALRARAFQHGVRSAIERLTPVDQLLAQASRSIDSAQGGDLDAAEGARRMLVDVDASLAEAEAELAWPDLDGRVRNQVAIATSWIAEFGTPQEREVVRTTMETIGKARAAKNAQEVQRHVEVIRRLGTAAFRRSPGAWERELDYCLGHVAETRDPSRASRLVEDGRAAIARNDPATLERAVRELWELMPDRTEDRALGHHSGVR
jgi:molecular chaperone DnaK